MCNCYSKTDPDLHAAYHFCDSGSGHRYCWDPKTNIQACIMDKPITQADCDSSYGGKGDWIVECEHYTGACPPGMTSG
ncbi:hypothetical protein CKAH01_14618 [Colletotrichum kahawae]|uniref:Uncharacterized protein n=1 Tax=Colletotrichum kahawae TaxID=34407 RepID=A0AAD9YN34_COLKA|nr:hypothetical protein CKAH01_14618 [Colletotrichum kahawae]